MDVTKQMERREVLLACLIKALSKDDQLKLHELLALEEFLLYESSK